MTLVKNYYCENKPKDDEIREALEIAKGENCVVWLHWFVKYDRWYRAIVDRYMTYDDVKRQIPRIYGM